MNNIDAELLSLNIRKRIIKMAYECQSNVHLGGALSMVDILSVLYGEVMLNCHPTLPYESRDKFILSKGHGALALFATLGELGYISEDLLSTYLQDGSDLCAHPVMSPSIGIEASNGSLGQGISMAVGVALSAKRKNYSYQTFTIVGNGECDEGIVWEALAAAVQYELDNLTIIVDDNKYQNDGESSGIIAYPNYTERFRSFGFDVIEIDGNSISQIRKAFTLKRIEKKPRVIVANTVKGKGISFMEGNNSWHHNRLTVEQYKDAMAELDNNEI